MRIIVFGAAGNVGSVTVREAVARGHEVTAVVRGPDREVPAGAAVATGDAGDADRVASLCAGQDAAVSAVRPPTGREPLQADLTDAVLAGAAASGVRMLIVGGAATLTVPDSGKAVLDDPRYIGEAWLAIAEAGAAQHRRCLEEGRADWTYLSPPAALAPGERSGRYRLGRDELLVDAEGVSGISTEDMAVAIVDELEEPRHRRMRFTVAAA
ncbi:NAD(P)-dependent oxidoreductase [Glycomyces xiaoerkulensis]|uniref:NAD(P)-dependent oxidoreductase n=1 Tax=Glycomyces xiaoerkulensis TaxID=2038139 RepID=UPI000C2698D8|nr:NAD(P)H-binding protein [Glycomyces xiaoerkulensis]